MHIVTCPNCGAKNRVESRAGVTPVCGRCRAPLTIGSDAGGTADNGHPIELTDETFSEVLRSAGPIPVLVDCWAPWCGPCRMLTPTIEQLARESAGRWLVAKLNVDDNPQVAGTFRVSSIPTLLLFKDGRLVDQLVGLRGKDELLNKLQSV